jgi:hypothetical protein
MFVAPFGFRKAELKPKTKIRRYVNNVVIFIQLTEHNSRLSQNSKLNIRRLECHST